MKKTLERLKQDTFGSLGVWRKATDGFLEIIHSQDKWNERDRAEVLYIHQTQATIIGLMRYIQALEDYGYELDEEWDKLLKSIEEAKQPKPTQTKDKTKKYTV